MRSILVCSPLLLAIPATGMRLPEDNRETLPTITTAHDAHEITTQEALRAHPVRLRAVVTYYDPYIDTRRPALFVTDGTGSVFVALASRPAVALRPGELVEITGTTGAGDYAPIVDHGQARVIGQSHLPATAPRVGVNGLLTGNSDGQWVEVEGVVHAVRESSENVFLDLELTDGFLTAYTRKDPGADFTRLIDSKVLVQGNAAPLFNHKGQMTGAHLLFPGLSTLKVEESSETDPFHLPLEELGNLLLFQPHSGLRHRVHVRGAVTLLWPGRMICVQSGQSGICAQTNKTQELGVGEMADVVGFPMMGSFTPTMAASVYRRVNDTKSAPATAISAQQALSGVYDARLVTIDGQVIGEGRDGGDPAIILAAGGLVYTAALPAALAQAPTRSIETGTWVRITGVCSVEADTTNGVTNGAGFSVGKSFRILERSSDDVVIVRRPSWWNPEHSLTVLAAASLIAGAALAGIFILRRRVKEQTAVIRAQLKETIALKEAAEYQATYDGLTGLRNRKAIFALLRREFDPASRTGSTTGIIMLDLDHFKKVNDTYGHVVGDKVLQETAKRLLRAVRSSDFVGRYGGEEFMIVLPHCDTTQCRACAERMRMAISSEPILVDGAYLTMTASLGMSVAVPHIHTEQQALIAADTALYHAKKNGRNQIAILDPTNYRLREAIQVI